MAEPPPQSPPIPFKMKAPRGHETTLTRGQTSKKIGDDHSSGTSNDANCNNNNINNISTNNSGSNVITSSRSIDPDDAVLKISEMDSSYYILEPHPDFSDYAATGSESHSSPATSPTCAKPPQQTTTAAAAEVSPQSSAPVISAALVSSSSLCNKAAPTSSSSSSPMSSPLLSDSLDYRRRLGQNYHRQYSHNYHPQPHPLQHQQHQQQQQQQQQQHYYNHQRQYNRSKSEDTGQGYYSVEDTIKVRLIHWCDFVCNVHVYIAGSVQYCRNYQIPLFGKIEF